MSKSIHIECRIPNEALTVQYSGQVKVVLKSLYDDLRHYRDIPAIKAFHNELEDYIAHGRFLNIRFDSSHSGKYATREDAHSVDIIVENLNQLVPDSYDHVPFIEFNTLSMSAQ